MEGKDVGYRHMDPRGFSILTTIMTHIAHDFSNLLTPLLTYPSYVRNDLPEGCFGHGLLDEIEKASQGMFHITTQLQILARRDENDREDLNLNTVVREVVIGLRSENPSSDVTVDMDMAGDLPLVYANVDDLLVAVINVGRNAVEAVGASGRVLFRTAYADLPEGEDVSGAFSSAGRFVSVVVSDDGPGIPEGLGESVFEPFVTTKTMQAKRGSGLGLTIVHKIMREHAGRIEVAPLPGGGTTVTLYLRALPEA